MNRLLPYFFLAVEVLVFHRRVLFTGRSVIPWDFTSYHLPLAAFLSQSFRDGELPLWDPFTYCGFPFYANIQAQVFYPPTLLAVLLHNLTGVGSLLSYLHWQVVLHVLMAGIFAFHLLRRLGAGRGAATLGATVFQLGGYFASQAQHLGAMNAGAWLPLAWLGIVALRDGFTWRRAAVVAFSLSMSVLAGFPAATLVVFVSCFILAGSLVAFRQAGWAVAAGVLIGCVWAGALAAVQLLPSWELSGLSIAPQRGLYTWTGGGIPVQGLMSLVWPNYYSLFDLDRYTLPWNPTFLYLYCGIPGLLLAALAILLRRPRYWAAFAATAGLSAFWMLGETTVIWRTLYPHLPMQVKSPMYPEFAMLAFVLSVAVLAGLGAQAFVASRSRAAAAALVLAAALDLILVGSGRPMNRGAAEHNPTVSRGRFEGSPETMAGIRGLIDQARPPYRVEAVQDSMSWAVGAAASEIPTPHGNDPLALARLLDFRRLFCKAEPWTRYCELSAPESPLVSFLNVRYIVSWAQPAPPPVIDAGYQMVKELPGHHVYENPSALPRFYLVNQVKCVEDRKASLQAVADGGFDPRQTAVVEGACPPVNRDASPGGGEPAGSVEVVEYTKSAVVLEVDAPADAFLVSSETYYPGWRASLDGKDTALVLTNVAFRGMPVPQGRHRIEMKFDPPIFKQGAIISAIAWLALAGLAARRRRKA